MMNNVLRTPESQFQNLPEYNFEPHYTHTNDGLRMHYVDDGPKNGSTIILLHGEPSWSFLYRKMIHRFENHGWRVLAPDLIGFGKSDKLVDRNDYTYEKHYDWIKSWFEQMDFDKTYLFVQDWGGLIGLRLVVDYIDSIEGLIIANTFLPAGYAEPNAAFAQWRDFSQNVSEFPVGNILNMATSSNLSQEVMDAYNAPFPEEKYKEGARQFPVIVPFHYDDPECRINRMYWQKLEKFNKPTLTLFSDGDPIMAGLERIFQDKIPGCKGQPHEIIKDAGHFLQEDKGEEIAEKIISWVNGM